MIKMWIKAIGDVHAKFDRYLELILDENNILPTIQVGDFGVFNSETREALEPLIPSRNFVIRGNHDNLSELSKMKNIFIPDGGMLHNTLMIGGASSIDRHLRTEGKDWWPDEQLSYETTQEILAKLKESDPTVVISHDAPHRVVQEIFGVDDHDNTRMYLDEVYMNCQPDLWIFGHWHRRQKMVKQHPRFRHRDTTFICLEELGTLIFNCVDGKFVS